MNALKIIWHRYQRRRAVKIMKRICQLHDSRETLLSLPFNERPPSVKKITGQIKKLERQLLAIPQRP